MIFWLLLSADRRLTDGEPIRLWMLAVYNRPVFFRHHFSFVKSAGRDPMFGAAACVVMLGGYPPRRGFVAG